MSLRQSEVIAPCPSDPASQRAVAAARRVVETLVRHTFSSGSELASAAATLEQLADRLELSSPSAQAVVDGLERRERYSRHDPVSGAHNPFAPPVEVVGRSDGSVAGSVRFGLPHQGPPGLVHGGVLAMVLDHVLALANSWAGTIGMTGGLELRYLRPTPLFADLQVTARQERLEGRKILTSGEITLDGEPCVTASGLFVAFPAPTPAPTGR
ncbi:PaaI family thioesterase [Nocardioides houyundeii]|uniref:PaaI family thioesterase n=1 Tax=Nocardioides houyundeii TaxID=2045452 RepID=UPI000C77A883|nr:PaaI family thioesterase [Nocardioides houyundeii]